MKRITIIFFYLLWVMQLCAQHKPSVWTLKQCIHYAIQNNVKLKQIELSKENQAVNLNTSKNSWLPSINATIGQNMDVGRSPSKDGTIKDQSSSNSSFYLQASMPLFEGFKIINEIKAQGWNVLVAIEQLNKAKEDVSVNVFTYYMQVLFKRELEKIAQEQVQLCLNQLRRTEILVESGKIAKAQLYDMEAQLEKDKVTLVNAENDVSLALLDLMQAMNLEIEERAFDIVAPEAEDMIHKYIENLVLPNKIYDEAVSFRPQIKAQEYLLESKRYTLDVAKSGFYPRLSLNASYNNYYYRYTDYENISFSDQWNQNARKTIGLTLSIPLFNRFQVRNSVRSAKIAVTNQKLEIEDARQTLYKEIRQAYANALAAQNVYMASKASITSSTKAYQYATESHDAGRISAFEYNEAKTKYIQSLSEQKRALYDFIFRCKILDFYYGTPISL